MILKPRHAPLQDTNDHFLANLQKDGTYSVVPRMSGGEITPAKLIAHRRGGEKFGLYTKITGGSASTCFGARVEQLPLVWKDLIDAGFESGHAYGKALRTVKILRRQRPGAASACRTRWRWRSASSSAIAACARRTS